MSDKILMVLRIPNDKKESMNELKSVFSSDQKLLEAAAKRALKKCQSIKKPEKNHFFSSLRIASDLHEDLKNESKRLGVSIRDLILEQI